ncbi:MAG: Na+/H+ antiporter subunit E [Deltaproteobacteria bacterium]|jgi:multicomponent Na+:H+ antiporter subunit E|nr:Na+/H+ antiporter subunit E [Deltaproteobacteria bacterium]
MPFWGGNDVKQINVFLGNIFLPLVWMALTGAFTFANFAVGFVISTLALWLISSPADVTLIVYMTRFWRFIGFFCFFVWELLVANLRVAYEVLTPGFQMRAAIVAIPLDAESDLEITVLANLITLTPGTLSLDVSPDRKTLYVHAMHVDDVEEFRQDIKQRMERRVMEVFK